MVKRSGELSRVADASGSGNVAVRCEVNGFVLNVLPDERQAAGTIGASLALRTCARIPLDESLVNVTIWEPPDGKPLASLSADTISITLSPISAATNGGKVEISDTELEQWCREKLVGQMLTRYQCLFVQTSSPSAVTLYASIDRIELVDFGKGKTFVDENDLGDGSAKRGLVLAESAFEFSVSDANRLKLKRNKARKKNLFKSDFNFEQLGIGGLDKEFADIFRRAFASRIYPPAVLEELGITHVRGMLLHGPPGTGKTLIARSIGKALRAKEPKVVNGPEILNKYVGQSEQNVRELFAEAEADEKKYGAESPLHIIIFDELDAICKQRGSNPSGAGVNDSVVNQLLSKIDGVDALNNILLIGMTNRLDMLDEALLRPGRLEVHIEIGLPDLKGRQQIFNVHTRAMRDAKRLNDDVSLPDLAEKTVNFSGAEIAGLVRSAVSYAFARNVDPQALVTGTGADGKANVSAAGSEEEVIVCAADFEAALSEVQPAFGCAQDAVTRYVLYGIIPFSSAAERVRNDLLLLARQVKDMPSSPLVSVLLWGASGVGKTALAASLIQTAGFPFAKLISAADLLGYQEVSRVMIISRIFQDAYKSSLSLIVLDDIERLVDYTPIGPRFSNVVLQAIMTLLKKSPPKPERRLLIIGTTSEPSFVQDSGCLSVFQLAYHVPAIKSKDGLIRCLTLAKQQPSSVTPSSLPSARTSGPAVKGNGSSHFTEAQPLADDQIHAVASQLYANGNPKIPVKNLFLALQMATEISRPDRPGAAAVVEALKDYGVSIAADNTVTGD